MVDRFTALAEERPYEPAGYGFPLQFGRPEYDFRYERSEERKNGPFRSFRFPVGAIGLLKDILLSTCHNLKYTIKSPTLADLKRVLHLCL